MKNILKIISEQGPISTSDVAQQINDLYGIRIATTRQKINRELSKKNSSIKKLNINLPHNTSIVYENFTEFDDNFYYNLVKTLNKYNSVYSYIFNILEIKNGMIPKSRFATFSGSPYRIKGHISFETILKNLVDMKLLKIIDIANKEYVTLNQYNLKNVFAQDKVEEIIIKMVKDWLIKNSLASSNAINNKNQYANFEWDITSPCYVYPIRLKNSNNGFIAVDVLFDEIDEEKIKYLINKSNIIKSQKKIPKALIIFIAKFFKKDALELAKKNGIIATTLSNLFGEETNKLFETLLRTLINAGEMVSSNFEEFISLFEKINSTLGKYANIAGQLFEFVVGHCYKELNNGWLEINKIIEIDEEAKEFDVVLQTKTKVIYFIECKGYNHKHLVKKDEIDYWFSKIRIVKEWIKRNKQNENLELIYGFITTSDFDNEAKERLEYLKSNNKKVKIFYYNGKEFLKYLKDKNFDDYSNMNNILYQYYFKPDF